MGWFGKKSQKESSASAAAAANGAYVLDVENLPVAVAVSESRSGFHPPPPPFAPAARGSVVVATPIMAPAQPRLQQQQQLQYQQQKVVVADQGGIPVVTNGIPYTKEGGTVVTAMPPVLVTASNTTAAPSGNNNLLSSSSAAAAAAASLSSAPFQNLIFSREPSFLHPCMHCGKNGRTRVVTSPHLATWIAVVALLFVFWPLCWLPLVFNCTRESRHYCTNCHSHVGTIQPFQDCCSKTRG
jgi:LITAF-like zinc ribbon domain